MSQLGASALSVLLSRVIVFALRVGSSVIIARALGTSGKGQVALVALVPGLLALLTNPGLGMASVYFIGKGKHSPTLVVRNTLSLTLLFGLLVSLLGVLAPSSVVSLLVGGEIDPGLMILGLASLPGLLLSANLSSALLGLQRIQAYSALIALQSAVQLVLNVLTLSILRLGVQGGVLSFVLGPYISALFMLLLLRPYWLGSGKWIDLALTWKSLGYGLRGHVGNVLQFLNYRADYFAVNLLAGSGALGVYTVAVSLAELLLYVPASVATVVFPRTAAASKAEISMGTPKFARHTIFLTSIASAALMIICYPVVLVVYGREFSPAVGPLMIMVPGIVALGWAKVLASDLAGRGLIHLNSAVALVTLVVMVAMDLLLIPSFKLIGASLASSVSYLVGALFTAVIYLRASGNSLQDTLLLRRADWQRYRAWGMKLGRLVGLTGRMWN